MDNNRSFTCGCCERTCTGQLLADGVILDNKSNRMPICKQCFEFLNMGLPALLSKMEKAKKSLQIGCFTELESSRPPEMILEAQSTSLLRETVTDLKKSRVKNEKKRAASNSERELFASRSSVLTKYIEGFVKGLEAAGLDRSRLGSEKNTAINNLLGISQKIAGERFRVMSGSVSRAEIRRMTRHTKETGIMVEEYINAVSDSLLDN